MSRLDLGRPMRDFRKTVQTLHPHFKKLGYETAIVGKWHMGRPPEFGPLAYGYDHFFGISEGGADYFRHKAIVNGEEMEDILFEGDEEIKRVGYLTDLFGNEAVNRIEQNEERPLFLSLHFTAPHWPWEGRDDIEVSKNMRDFFHKDGGSLQVYANMVAAMDDNVGKVLAALKKKNSLQNTIIVFTSDNGGERFSDTWPFIGVKGELLEGGIRVPLLAQWLSKIPAGEISDQVMSSMDFLPTLLKLVGAEMLEGEFDGADLSDQLLAKAPPIKRTLYWRHKAGDQRALRDGDWKYLKIGQQEHLLNLADDQRERAWLEEMFPDRFVAMREMWLAWNETMLPYPEGSFSQVAHEYFADRY